MKSEQELKPNRILEAGAEAEATEGCFTGLLHMTDADCFLIESRITGAGIAEPTVGCALPH